MRHDATSAVRVKGAKPGPRRPGRAHSRIACRIACALAGHNAWEAAFAVNISQNGCGVVLESQTLRCGQFVRLRFQHIAPVIGIVRWVRGARAGIEFARPIDADALTRMAGCFER